MQRDTTIIVVKEIVSVSEMARTLGLSRARFYELIRAGIFPAPSRDEKTQRPFYNREQQEQCLTVRKTNCGVNGKVILFYGRRIPTNPAPRVRTRQNQTRESRPQLSRERQSCGVINDVRHGLEQLGLSNIGDAEVRNALADEWPDGYSERDPAELLSAVFRRLNW